MTVGATLPYQCDEILEARPRTEFLLSHGQTLPYRLGKVLPTIRPASGHNKGAYGPPGRRLFPVSMILAPTVMKIVSESGRIALLAMAEGLMLGADFPVLRIHFDVAEESGNRVRA
jgi:hypothetical protein